MSKRVAFYVRVSTDGQTTENQRLELEKVAKGRGWEIAAVFDDNGISGSKGREHRKQFDQLIKAATRGEFDLVASWSVDRLGRSLQDLIGFLSELHGVGCDLYLHQQGIDTTTPAGKMMFQMCGVFAEFERSMIQERVKAGLERARANGKTLGRPSTSDQTRKRVLKAKGKGLSLRKIAAEVGVSLGTVHNIIKAA
ncbi:MAG: recombinase family protein [Rhodospirillales bacterium]|nr:recombinase family protein [Rhodospirillales bacterium]